MKKLSLILLLAIASAIIFSNCEKEENVSNEEALNAIKDYATAQNMFTEVTDETDKAARISDDSVQSKKGNPPEITKSSSYPQITITPFDNTTWPKTISINYGDTNMLCKDGRERRGIINIEATDLYRNPGSQLTTTFDDFYQNDHKVMGKRILTNDGENQTGNLTYTLQVTDGHIITPEGKHIYYEETITREWIAGESTVLNPWDDNYLLKGSQSGISSDSVDYTLAIHENDPLDVMVDCKWIRGGKLNVDIASLNTITIDYGNGTCDANAIANIDGKDYSFVMK